MDLARRQHTASSRAMSAGLPTTLVAGEEVGDIHIGNRTYDVKVWSTPEARNSLTALHELPIDTPDGGHVRLHDVADVRIAPTPNVIKHESPQRRIDVHCQRAGTRPRLRCTAMSRPPWRQSSSRWNTIRR